MDKVVKLVCGGSVINGAYPVQLLYILNILGQEISKPQKSAVQKLNGKERAELEAIPLQIDDLEKEQASISESLGDPEIYKNRPADVITLQENLKIIEAKLSTLMTRWENLLERSSS